MKINCLYTALALILCTNLLFTVVKGADTVSNGDIRKVDSLNTLAFTQKRFDVAKALNNLFNAENLATTIAYQKGLATTYLYQAGIYHQNGYENRALSTYYKSLQLFRALNDTFNIAFTSQQIALALQADGQSVEALQMYQESLKVYTALNKQEDIANIKNSTGLVNMDMGQLDKAEKNFNEALLICSRVRYAYGEKKAYYNLGLLEERRGHFTEAAA